MLFTCYNVAVLFIILRLVDTMLFVQVMLFGCILRKWSGRVTLEIVLRRFLLRGDLGLRLLVISCCVSCCVSCCGYFLWLEGTWICK